MATAPWNVYILSCADGSLYTGVTTDIGRRVAEHNSGSIGAKYTRAHRPVTVAYQEICASRSEACKREAALKRLTRAQKLKLISAA